MEEEEEDDDGDGREHEPVPRQPGCTILFARGGFFRSKYCNHYSILRIRKRRRATRVLLLFLPAASYQAVQSSYQQIQQLQQHQCTYTPTAAVDLWRTCSPISQPA
jgi:hypothetical protein